VGDPKERRREEVPTLSEEYEMNMTELALVAAAYLAMIPGMYCIACAVDVLLADSDLSLRGSPMEKEWGLAILWPVIVAFLLAMLVFALAVAPFYAVTYGRQYLRDEVTGRNE
jgi:uncharacterized RDD family membrane protein YckC